MNSRFWLAVLVAAIIPFFGGWLIWGILLGSYFEANTTEGALALQRAEEDMILWAIIVAHLVWGFLITWIIKETGSTTVQKGAVTALIVIVLFVLGMDLFLYSMMDMFTGLGVIVVDVIANGVLAVITGAAVGWILGRGQVAELQ